MKNSQNGLSCTSEYEELIQKYQILIESVSNFESERANLLDHICPSVEAQYLGLVGKYELELLEMQARVYEQKRILEHIQSAINNQSEILVEVITILVKEEMKEQYQKIKEEADRLMIANMINASGPVDEDELKEIRRIYRKLARLMHPDLNSDLTDDLRGFWNHVCEAYSRMDLERLQMFEILAIEKIMEPEYPVSRKDELKSKIQSLSDFAVKLLGDIDRIKNSYPLNLAPYLDDRDRIQKEISRILNEIKRQSLQLEHYQNAIKQAIL